LVKADAILARQILGAQMSPRTRRRTGVAWRASKFELP